MKKWFFICAAIAVIIVVGQLLQQRELNITPRSYAEYSEPGEHHKFITIDPEQVRSGRLMLINGEYSLSHSGIAEDLVTLSADEASEAGFRLENSEITISEEVLLALKQMLSAAKDEGVSGFLLTSGYRSFEQQAKLYEQQGSDYALPAGYSEHNSGLAVDISSLNAKMELAPEGEWLRNHAAQFGFILRYPPNKQQITGIQYEPWHFRYVGLPHSLIIKENDWVLEEYVQYLASNPHIKVNGQYGQFLIDYYDESTDIIELPAGSDYYISGDNVGGVIVTSWKGEQ